MNNVLGFNIIFNQQYLEQTQVIKFNYNQEQNLQTKQIGES